MTEAVYYEESQQELHHHPRGMSRWPAVLTCPTFEGKGGNANAELGTEKHRALAAMLEHLKKEGELLLRDDSADFFDAGVRRVAETIRDCLIINHLPPLALHIEERVQLDDGVFGTADVWYESGASKILWVWDFKTFRNPGRDYTAQLAGYALAIYQMRKRQLEVFTHGEQFLPEQFVLRTAYGDSRGVDTVSLSLEELQRIHADAMTAFSTGGAPRQCNWCELCAKAPTCPAFRAIAEAVTEENSAPAQAIAQWTSLPQEYKAQLLVLAETVVKWADAVREKAKADLLGGGTIEDAANGISYKLQQRAGRKVPRTADACRMLTAQGVSTDAIRKELSLAASSVKALLKGVGIRGKAAESLLESVCDASAGSATMVRA